MGNMPWFRFYSEAINDRKIARAIRISGQPKATVLGTWLILLCLANESPERGKLMLAEDIWLEEDEIIAETGLDLIAFGKIINAFQQLNMVSIGAGYEVLNWGKRQYKSDNSTERVRKYREKKREEKQDETDSETLQKRSSNVIDTDTEQIQNKKREKNTSEIQGHYEEVLAVWKKYFPDKSQPRKENKTLRRKLATRLKDKYFAENWERALEVASESEYLHRKSETWFTVSWFLRNDEHWERCLNGNYGGADKSSTPNKIHGVLQEMMEDAKYGNV